MLHFTFESADKKKQTFGAILSSWEKDQTGIAELGKYFRVLKRFSIERNHLHLAKITENPNYFTSLCEKEEKYLAVAAKTISFLREIKS